MNFSYNFSVSRQVFKRESDIFFKIFPSWYFITLTGHWITSICFVSSLKNMYSFTGNWNWEFLFDFMSQNLQCRWLEDTHNFEGFDLSSVSVSVQWCKRHLIHYSTRSSVSIKTWHYPSSRYESPKSQHWTFSVWLSFSLDAKSTEAFVCWMFVVWLELIEIWIAHLMAYLVIFPFPISYSSIDLYHTALVFNQQSWRKQTDNSQHMQR